MLLNLIRQIFKRAEAPPPDNAALEAELTAGKRAHFAGQNEMAEQHYRRALAIDPLHAEALFCLGVTCRVLNRLDEAMRFCHHAYELDGSRAAWRESVMHISNDIGKAEGVTACEIHVRKQGDFAAWLGLANALRETGRFDEAATAYARALSLKPDSPFIARRYGALLAVTGDLEGADTQFRASAGAGLWPDGAMHLSNAFFEGLARDRESLVAGIAKLEGTCGDAAGRTVILISGDPVYLRRFLFALLNSLRQNGGIDFLIHVHIVNPDTTILADIEHMKGKLAIALHSTWEHPVMPEGEGARSYYAAARFLQLPRLLEAYRAPLLLLDLDLLVVGRLDAIQFTMQSSDIGLIRWHETRWDPWDMFWASAIWYQPTDGAREFAEWTSLYAAACLREGQWQWLLDQSSLFSVHAWMTRQGKAPKMQMLAPELACLAGNAPGGNPPEGAVFWSVIYSLKENHSALEHPLFRKYADTGHS